MKNYLFTALFVGCLVAAGLAQQHEVFRITDSMGRCWQCAPGATCVPCSTRNDQSHRNPWGPVVPFPDADPNHPTSCPTPTAQCNDPASRNILFPMSDSARFYQCSSVGGVWSPQVMECQCGTLFDYFNQRCEFPWDWTPFCANLQTPILPIPCEDDPTSPTDPTTPPTDPTDLPTTTPDPCKCIPWFPCWCNPCFGGMPCMG